MSSGTVIGFGHSANVWHPDTSLFEAVMNGSCCRGRGV